MWLLYKLLYLFSLLPLPLLYLIADLLFIPLYYLIKYRKQIVRKNLIHAFPTKTKKEWHHITKAFYHNLCDLLVEHIKALTLSPKLLLQRVKLYDIKRIEKFYKEGKSIILVSGHFGNWEWVAHALALQLPYKIYAGYQPLHHAAMDRIVLSLRSRFQRKALPYYTLLKHAIKDKKTLHAIALLSDQAPLDKEKGYETIFLNQPTKVVLTAAQLAQRCNYPIFYVSIKKIKRGQYHATPILLTDTPLRLSVTEIAELYMKKLEADIIQNPPLWLWTHKRWK